MKLRGNFSRSTVGEGSAAAIHGHTQPYAPQSAQASSTRSKQTTSINKEFPIKRTSITLADPIYETGLAIATNRGFGQSFSAYVAWLIQRDAEGGVTREEATSTSRTGVLAGTTSSRRKPMSARPKPAAKPAAKKPAATAKATKPATGTRAKAAAKTAKAAPAKPGRKPGRKPAAAAAKSAKSAKSAQATAAPKRTTATKAKTATKTAAKSRKK